MSHMHIIAVLLGLFFKSLVPRHQCAHFSQMHPGFSSEQLDLQDDFPAMADGSRKRTNYVVTEEEASFDQEHVSRRSRRTDDSTLVFEPSPSSTHDLFLNSPYTFNIGSHNPRRKIVRSSPTIACNSGQNHFLLEIANSLVDLSQFSGATSTGAAVGESVGAHFEREDERKESDREFDLTNEWEDGEGELEDANEDHHTPHLQTFSPVIIDSEAVSKAHGEFVRASDFNPIGQGYRDRESSDEEDNDHDSCLTNASDNAIVRRVESLSSLDLGEIASHRRTLEHSSQYFEANGMVPAAEDCGIDLTGFGAFGFCDFDEDGNFIKSCNFFEEGK